MEKFKNPPKDNRMLQIIHCYYDGDLAKNYEKLGFGGIVANVDHNNYLESEEGWSKFLKCLNDFQSQGMLFWIYDEKGYPSGKAGGLTLRDHPEYEALGVFCSRTEGKGRLRHKLPAGKTISVIAAPIHDGKYSIDKKIDLTGLVINGQTELEWDAPDGKWGILSFHVDRAYEGTHCVANYSDPLPYINIMDREAVARFIQLTHEAYRQRCGDDINYIQAFFTDEPSLMTLYLKKADNLLPPIPWSRSFEDDFRSRCGYDIIPRLPYLFVDCGDKTVYIRLHFWKVVAELIEENFYAQIQDWCRDNGTSSSGHALCEEQIFWHAAFEGDLYRDLRRMDIPGIDMLSSNPTQLARSKSIPIPKFVSSVTHMIGSDLCMSETSSFSQKISKQPCSFEQRIGTINYQYVLGLTCITSYYGLDEFKDGELRIFNDHIGRLGYMLTGGKHIADIGIFYPIHSFWGTYIPTSGIAYEPPYGEKARRINNEFGSLSIELLANQRDFDYIDDQAILESRIEDSCLKVAGESFKLIVLPHAWVIPLNVYQKIEAFVNSGGFVVSLGGLPDTGMLEDETAAVKHISDSLGKSSHVAVVRSIGDAVNAIKKMIEPDLSLDDPCRELFYLHYRKERDIYFISNSLDAPIERKITFRCSGNPELWHPTTGEIYKIDFDSEEKSIKINLKPFEGVFIVF